MPFQKGNKLAKGGRRPGAGDKPGPAKVVKNLIAEIGPAEAMKSFQFCVELRDDPKVAEGLRFEAGKEIMNRVLGKSAQVMKHDGLVFPTVVYLDAPNKEEPPK